jgi:hypothetical protein
LPEHSKRTDRLTVELPADVSIRLRQLAASYPHTRAHSLAVAAARSGFASVEAKLLAAARDAVVNARDEAAQ